MTGAPARPRLWDIGGIAGAERAFGHGADHPLLDWLGWHAGTGEELRRDRAALLGVARLCRRVMLIARPERPGLCAIGAELDGAALTADPAMPRFSLSGVGLQAGAAFAACMGEAAERLAQVEQPGASRPVAVTLRAWPCGAQHDWPAALIYRRPGGALPLAPLSIGCAAAPSPEAARLAAVLEVIERDAVAVWWRGGRAPRRFPAWHPAAAVARDVRDALGLPPDDSGHDLIDITTDLGIPTVAALSFDADGRGLCFGSAARTGFVAAARAAALELAQNELAVSLAAAKEADGGPAACTPRDRAHLVRHRGVIRADALCGTNVAEAAALELPDATPEAALGAVGHRLGQAGFTLLLHEAPCAWHAVATARAIVPGLCSEPSRDVPQRLADAIAAHGGGPGLRLRLSLFD